MQKQIALEIGQNRLVRRATKPVFGEWLYDEKNQKAWYLLRKLYSVFKFGKSKLGLVIDERYALPINPFASYSKDELENLTNLNTRAAQALKLAMGQAEKEGHQNIIAWGITAAVSAIVFVVVILALLVASGRMGA